MFPEFPRRLHWGLLPRKIPGHFWENLEKRPLGVSFSPGNPWCSFLNKNFLGDSPGFEPGTFRLWDLHATKELPRFVTVKKDFLWYLKMYLVLKRFLYYSLPNLESQRKNSQNLHVATWFSPRLVRIWRNKWLCLHYFTLNNVLQHQPKLVNAGLQSSSIFPVSI